eukprot:4330379-Pyramimonas_sp.AAC.1
MCSDPIWEASKWGPDIPPRSGTFGFAIEGLAPIHGQCIARFQADASPPEPVLPMSLPLVSLAQCLTSIVS